MTNLPKLQDIPSLSERAYEIIREALLTLKFKPGDYISIQDLSDQLGISRTPVRDALLRLEKDGLVSIIPYKGACVTDISDRDIKEIMELRILLEGYAAEKAAKFLSVSELEQGETILERSEEAYATGQPIESAIIGHQLHELILSKINNERFSNIIYKLDIHYERIRQYSVELRDQRLSKSINEHRTIFKALKNRDADAARVAMMDHLSSVRDDVLTSLFSSENNIQTENENKD